MNENRKASSKVEFDVDPEVVELAQQAIREGRKLDLRDDVVFKSLLSKDTKESNEVLRFIIGAVIGQKVAKAVVLNPEITPDMLVAKKMVLDVRCEFNNGEQADIEMQKEDEGVSNDVLKRMTAYNASQMAVQLHKGDIWGNIHTCYQITFLGYKLFKDSVFHHTHDLYDKVNHTECDCFQLHTLELPKIKSLINKPLETLRNDEICGILLLYGGDSKYRELFETVSMKVKEVGMAINTLDHMSKKQIEWERELTRIKTRIDYNTSVKYHHDAGVAEGLEQGLKQGLEQGRVAGSHEKTIEIIRNLKKVNIPLETIAQSVGVTLEEVQNA